MPLELGLSQLLLQSLNHRQEVMYLVVTRLFVIVAKMPKSVDVAIHIVTVIILLLLIS